MSGYDTTYDYDPYSSLDKHNNNNNNNNNSRNDHSNSHFNNHHQDSYQTATNNSNSNTMNHNDALTNYLNAAMFGGSGGNNTTTAGTDTIAVATNGTNNNNSGYHNRHHNHHHRQYQQHAQNYYQDNSYHQGYSTTSRQQPQQSQQSQQSNYPSYHPNHLPNSYSNNSLNNAFSISGNSGNVETTTNGDNPTCGSTVDNNNNTASTNTNDYLTAAAIAAATGGMNMNTSTNPGGAGAGGYLIQQPMDYNSTALDYYNLINQRHQLQQVTAQQQQQQHHHYHHHQQQQQESASLYDFLQKSNSTDVGANSHAAKTNTHEYEDSKINNNNSSNNNNSNSNSNNNTATDSVAAGATRTSPVDFAGFANSYFGIDANNNNLCIDSLVQQEQKQTKGMDYSHHSYHKNMTTGTANAAATAIGIVNPALVDPSNIAKNYQQAHYATTATAESAAAAAAVSRITSSSLPNHHPQISNELSKLELSIISLSENPLSAQEIIDKITFRCNEVLTRFLPCVEFLVACQQELRAGLARAMQFCGRGMSVYNSQEYYKTCFESLPARFFERNKLIMPSKELTDSYEGIKALLVDVKTAEQKGNLDGMKNAFLGGMRDGESWGLRKWLSKNGGALKICNDVELIWGALRNLSRDEATTKELAKILRPKARFALKRLQEGVPKAYQEVSTAHPYLPFFHRLECALKGLSEFDPEEDDVICIDDSDDDDDEIQVTDANGVPIKATKPVKTDDAAVINVEGDDHGDNNHQESGESNNNAARSAQEEGGDSSIAATLQTASAIELAQSIDGIASKIEAGTEIRPSDLNFDDYWTRADNYIVVLRLFQKILLENNTNHLTDHVSEQKKYESLIKNPLCFRDIVATLCQYETSSRSKGELKRICPNLKKWNVYEGKYLIQAVDLVFLNNLAFLGKNPNVTRKFIQALRTKFWREIRKGEKKFIPTRRTETSDFVIRKK